jgi:hypothetical protein
MRSGRLRPAGLISADNEQADRQRDETTHLTLL